MSKKDFPARLRSREVLVGFRLSLACAPIAERLARVGFDYLLIDVQHGLLDYGDCIQMLTAITAGGTHSLVRVASQDPAMMGKLLDAGADGVIVPAINSAEEAKAVVRACRYPPTGARSWGPARAELFKERGADYQPAIALMVETVEGLQRVDEIAAVAGVDALYVGPMDLALALGEKPSSNSFAVAEGVRKIAASALRAGIGCGIQALGSEASNRRIAEGFTYIVCGTDAKSLESAASDTLKGIDRNVAK